MSDNGSNNGLLIGRWQTLHEGHDWLIEQVRARGLRPVIAIRDTPITAHDPLTAYERKDNLHDRYGDRIKTIIIPDIYGVYYGRDVGYEIVGLVPPNAVASISGTAIRRARK